MSERVKMVREDVRLNQRDFAERIGVTAATISRIENGERPLTDRTLIVISREFNVNEKWLRTGEGKMRDTPNRNTKAEFMQQIIDTYNLEDIDQIWLKILLELDPEGKAELKAAALRIAEIAASFTSDIEAGAEIVADAQAAHDKAFEEWDRELSEEEMIERYRARLRAAKKGSASSTTYEKPATGRKTAGAI